MRKRLCYTASPETRKYAEDLKITIHNEVDENIADVLVPNCIYRGGCPEMESCGLYIDWLELDSNIGSHNLWKRYDAYNKAFYEERKQ